jgi:hypothetical protein
MATDLSNTNVRYIELQMKGGTLKVLVESPLTFKQTAELLGNFKGPLCMRSLHKGTKVYYSVVESGFTPKFTPKVASAVPTANVKYIVLETSVWTFKVLVESPLNFEQTAELLGSCKGSLYMRSTQKENKIHYSVVESGFTPNVMTAPNVAIAVPPKSKEQKVCQNGDTCKYLANNTCTFFHPKTLSGGESAGPSAPKVKPRPKETTPCTFGNKCRNLADNKCKYFHAKTSFGGESESESGESLMILGPTAPGNA